MVLRVSTSLGLYICCVHLLCTFAVNRLSFSYSVNVISPLEERTRPLTKLFSCFDNHFPFFESVCGGQIFNEIPCECFDFKMK